MDGNLNNVDFKNAQYIQNKGINNSVTLLEMKEEFKIFKGNYMYMLNNFQFMSEREQKLFILYSIFYFDLKFYYEGISNVASDELLAEVSRLAMKFTKYGSYTGCSVGFKMLGSDFLVSAIGYNISSPLKSTTYFKNLDVLTIKELAKFANSGYSAQTEEEIIFQSLQEGRREELDAFKNLLAIVSKNKTR